MEPNYTYGMLFGGEPVSESERARVLEEVSKVGSLTFDIQKTDRGWSAQCKEVPAIIAGNTNPNPNQIEIESALRSAIFAAFDVKVEQASPYFAEQDIFRYSTT
jgi:hypothetical protein